MRNQYKNLTLFLIITFTIPLISVYMQGIIDNSLIQFLLYGVEAASPSIAALIIIYMSKKGKAFWIKNIKTKKISEAFILPVIIVITTMFLSKSIYFFLTENAFVTSNISIRQFIIILWTLIAEEIGWRGYLQPLLSKQMKKVWLIPLVVGAIWALWHYHYFLFTGMQVPFILFFIGCIVDSYIYNYLLVRTENNLISAMMYHFAWNLGLHLFALNPVNNNGSLLPYLILIIVEALFLIILFLQKKYYKQRKFSLSD